MAGQREPLNFISKVEIDSTVIRQAGGIIVTYFGTDSCNRTHSVSFWVSEEEYESGAKCLFPESELRPESSARRTQVKLAPHPRLQGDTYTAPLCDSASSTTLRVAKMLLMKTDVVGSFSRRPRKAI